MSVGESFFTPHKPEIGVPRHLWVILTDPDVDGKVVIANFSSDVANNDPGQVIAAREHESLPKPSHVRCDRAKLSPLATLKTDTRLSLQWTKPAKPELVAKMKAILLRSKHTPVEVRAALKVKL